MSMPLATRLRDRVAKTIAATRRLYFIRVYGMTIGEGSMIARTAKLDKTHPEGIVIGRNTRVAFGASILAHDFVYAKFRQTTIGDNCLIGAGATVLAGVTIGDSCIVSALALVTTDIPHGSIVMGNPAVIVESNIRTGRWGMRHPHLIPPVVSAAADATRPDAQWLLKILREHDPEMGLDLFATPLKEAGFDSFGLVAVRADLEQWLGREIPDRTWSKISTADDILGAANNNAAGPAPASALREVLPASERRVFDINMPQMALSGLSESWLFKEIGDTHWSMLTNGLQMPSSQMTDAEGNRLYATFTRLRIDSEVPLSRYRENDRLEFDARVTRYGGGMFFSDFQLVGKQNKATAQVMSSFSRKGEAGANTSLLKGQPAIPADCAIPALAALPEFAKIYRAVRSETQDDTLFECEYDLVPPHDINGVGLLYFAAYPIISDICASRYDGWNYTMKYSTTTRDVYYFANSDPTDTLIFRLHRWDTTDGGVLSEATLSRRSDGVRMAFIRTHKRPS